MSSRKNGEGVVRLAIFADNRIRYVLLLGVALVAVLLVVKIVSAPRRAADVLYINEPFDSALKKIKAKSKKVVYSRESIVDSVGKELKYIELIAWDYDMNGINGSLNAEFDEDDKLYSLDFCSKTLSQRDTKKKWPVWRRDGKIEFSEEIGTWVNGENYRLKHCLSW